MKTEIIILISLGIATTITAMVYIWKAFKKDLEKYIVVLEHHSEELAINFADWVEKLSPASRVSVWSKDGQYQGMFNMDKEQLLQKYKRDIKKRKL